MACGCLVVGYHGGGGREFLKRDFSFPIEAGDILQFAKDAEFALQLTKAEPEKVMEMTSKAAAFISRNYSPEREERELVKAWREIISQRRPA